MAVDTIIGIGYEKKPRPIEGYKIESYYCECGCKKGYYHYVKLNKPVGKPNTIRELKDEIKDLKKQLRDKDNTITQMSLRIERIVLTSTSIMIRDSVDKILDEIDKKLEKQKH